MVDAWSKGRLDSDRHALSCYRQAIAQAPTDLKIYSTFNADLTAAIGRRLAASAKPSSRRLSVLPSVQDTSFVPPLAIILAGIGVVLALCGLATFLRRRNQRW